MSIKLSLNTLLAINRPDFQTYRMRRLPRGFLTIQPSCVEKAINTRSKKGPREILLSTTIPWFQGPYMVS